MITLWIWIICAVLNFTVIGFKPEIMDEVDDETRALVVIFAALISPLITCFFIGKLLRERHDNKQN